MTVLRAEHDLSLQLAAAAVDAKTGVIRGVTVGQAGVEATGKFIHLDADGNLTRDPNKAVRKLQIVTDSKTLETLMKAAEAGGLKFKSREDHSDEIGARLGYADNFSLQGDKVICDLHVFDSYRNRELLLETAAKTPEEVGISIDMDPSYEVHNGRALMRIETLYAVDVVDEGAITHDGLFLSRGVDNTPKVTLSSTQPSPAMADEPAKKPATLEDCMSALTGLATTVGTLAGAVAKMQSAATPGEELAATMKEINTKLAAQATAVSELKQTAAALGQKPAGAAAPGADAAAETERARLSAEQAKGAKTYLDLVDETKAARKADLDSGKLKASDVHQLVMSAHPAKYREHLKAGGIYDQSRDPKNRAA